ncbi:MAG: phosphate butyryltransferase [Deltaproteobacteria bacterium]|nr:phosphate butyryltransferase [Deltaproteobacteria bacterium]
MGFDRLRASLAGLPPRRVAVAGAASPGVLAGLALARDQGLAMPLLCGEEPAIRAAAAQEGIDLGGMEVCPASGPEAAARAAVALVREGAADVLLKGHVPTPAFLRAVLDRVSGLRCGALLTHLAAFEIPALDRVVFLTDSGMIPFPDLETKARILENAVAYLARIGIPAPHVALLAANEEVDPAIPASADAAALRAMATRFAPAVTDGPLGLDLALSPAAAAAKGVDSPVAGRADLLLCPDVVAGNLLGKSFIYVGGARAAGVVLGARCPVVMLSRADTPDTRVRSLVLALAGAE